MTTDALARIDASIARHESQNAGDPFHYDLTNHLYVALVEARALIPEPHTDDEREALASRLVLHADGIDRIAHGPTLEGADMRTASALIRGRGPITDNEREALAALVYTVPGHDHIPNARRVLGIHAAQAVVESDVWRNRGGGPITDEAVEHYCIVMHDAYESAAASEGWATQEASRKPWADVPDANKRTMRVAVRAVLEAARDAEI